MNDLKDKKILFIAPEYFGYEKDIRNKLEEKGANVWYIKENIDYGMTLIRLIDAEKKREKYFSKKIREYQNINFDYIFCIRVNGFSPAIMKEMREIFGKAKVILYFWDSVKNMKNPVAIAEYADRVYSFDRANCIKYGWKFRPLFFKDIYKRIGPDVNFGHKKVFMIATLTPQRVEITEHLAEIFEKQKIEYELYLYMDKILYLKRKLFNKEYNNIKYSKIINKPMKNEEIIEKLKHCNAVLDICHSSQSGLTMRTIETFGARRKLITNNQDIINYDIYDPEKIYIYTGDDKNLIDFINNEKKGEELNSELYSKYSVDGWIDEIFYEE